MLSRFSRTARAVSSRRWIGTLVCAEHNNAVLDKSTLASINAARQLNQDITVLVAGKGCGSVAEAASKIAGVSKVVRVEGDALEHPVADTMAQVLLHVQKATDTTHVFAPTSSVWKDVLPRAAATIDVQPISDITAVLGLDTYKRPTYAGNAIATVKSLDKIMLVTVRPTAFPAEVEETGSASIEDLAVEITAGSVQWLSESVKQDDKPQLASASRVVSGGRALESTANFERVLQPLCDQLGAAMGASRAAVDAGYVPNEMQVGQTGKVVAPELYMAVGISGAIQHLAGMKDSKTIVAINKDPDAPIFQVADYGLVANLFDAVPEFTKKAAQ
mmetsp:Transcript_5469/g.13066  ORF Transcript_5469/g.13066 Transcript_5469/m.13066 type:complete len:332 (+) Transcript_5469:57-1052(+)